MIKTNIKMRVTPAQSRRVQEICFENGIGWGDGDKKLYFPLMNGHLVNEICLIIRKSISFSTFLGHFGDGLQEIDADLFIKTNGTCEEDLIDKISNELEKETYLTKYTSQPKDLESALKKIESLRIALKKKVEKNKNQALEITKLLEEKKAMEYDINIAINHLLEMKELKAKLKEKDTIISYFESKLK